jgi:cytoskeletal protein CcmA (bactofilin family)
MSAPTATTMGPTIKIKGDLSGEEDFLIQGQVDGTINFKKNNLTIGEKGRIQADVSAQSINVEGELQGDLQGEERVTIAKSGKVRGNIVAPRVILEDGAMFKGSIDMEPRKAEASTSKPSQSSTSKMTEPKQGEAVTSDNREPAPKQANL